MMITVVVVAALLSQAGVGAGARAELESFTGFPASEKAAFEARKERLNAAADTESLKAWHMSLAKEPHVAGTEGGARVVEKLRVGFEEMGLKPEVWDFWPLLATPEAAELEVVAPEKVKLDVAERPVKGDPASAEQGFGWNAYSGSGEVTAGVVYANFGTKADFEKLAAMKVDVKGKIVVARYGGNYRGYKAKFAEAAGAVGLVIYTDPADSGYMRGLVYPEGGFANDCCIQRGSILTLGYQGDPLTPGVAAMKDVERADVAAVALPKIPVQPVGYAAAKEILSRMTGAAVPEGWQGGLPFTYRVEGGESLRVRLKVQQKREIKKASNVIATITGSMYPEQMVIVGCHHDAWNNGAADPLAGTIALMQCAKAFAELSKEHPPLRTIVFATWDAEEFGIIGSSEWVEANRENLNKNAVAYINLDMASMGLDFGSAASPTLRRVIAQAAGDVPQPGQEGKTVLDAWRARAPDAGAPWHGAFGDLGGGSDHVGFLCHAGVPSCSLGGGGSKGTSYHSAYDTLPWYWKTVGTDYQSAQMVTRVTSAMVHRLAYATVLPLDASEVGRDVAAKAAVIAKQTVAAGLFANGQWEASEGAKLMLERAGDLSAASASMTKRVQAAVDAGTLSSQTLAEINGRLMSLDRAWVAEDGLPGRGWFKNRYAAPDEDSGYASWILPGLWKGVTAKDAALLEAEALRCVESLESMGQAVLEAEQLATKR